MDLCEMAARVAARHLESYGTPFPPGWSDLVSWVQGKFRKHRFTVTDNKSGSAIWDIRLNGGSKSLVYLRVSGHTSESRQYEFMVYGDQRYGPMESIRPPRGTAPTLREMKAAVTKVLKASPNMVAQFGAKGITPAQAESLQAAVTRAKQQVKDTIQIPLEYWSNGSVEAGDFWIRYEYNPDESRTIFNLQVNVKRKIYKLSVFGNDGSFKTLRGLISALGRTPRLLAKGLRELDSLERRWALGEVTPDTVVRRAVSAEVSYSTVDEWMDTNVNVTLMLRTKKSIPKSLLIKWVKDHWSEVQVLLPKKPPPSMDRSRQRGRTDYWDEPSPGLQWQDPRLLSIRDLGEVRASQEGNRATISLNFAHR